MLLGVQPQCHPRRRAALWGLDGGLCVAIPSGRFQARMHVFDVVIFEPPLELFEALDCVVKPMLHDRIRFTGLDQSDIEIQLGDINPKHRLGN